MEARRIGILLALTLTVLFGTACPSHASDIIKGTIYQRDLAGSVSPLSGAYVEILDLDRLSSLSSATTSSATSDKGSFVLSSDSWEPATYRIRVSKRGYVSYNCRATLKGDRPMAFSVTLPFDPYNPSAAIFADPSCAGYGSNYKAYSPDGTRYAKVLLTGEAYNWRWHFAVYRLGDDEIICESPEIGNDPKAIAWSRDSSKLAVMYHGAWPGNNNIKLYDPATGAVLHTIVDHLDMPQCHQMVFSSDDAVIFTGERDQFSESSRYVVSSFPSGSGSTIEHFKQLCGVNLPWEHYGWDAGDNPWGGAHGGFSDNLAQLDADFGYLRSQGVNLVRVFLLCDARTGIEYDPEGNPTGLDQYVLGDVEALITVAEKYDIKLILSLFDYMLADGKDAWDNTLEPGTENAFGEHPEFITNPGKRSFVINNMLGTLIDHFKNRHAIYAWEPMNEPDLAMAAPAANVHQFVHDCAEMIRSHDLTARVTLGCRSYDEMGNWTDVSLNLRQFHFYEGANGGPPYPFSSPPALPGYPILAGELQPEQVCGKLDLLFANGYAGGAFWSLNGPDGNDFRAVASDFKSWMDSH